MGEKGRIAPRALQAVLVGLAVMSGVACQTPEGAITEGFGTASETTEAVLMLELLERCATGTPRDEIDPCSEIPLDFDFAWAPSGTAATEVPGRSGGGDSTEDLDLDLLILLLLEGEED